MGVQPDAQGVNFAVFSAHADAIDLCVFDASGRTEQARFRLPGRSGDVWHGHLAGALPGLVYGLRAHGPWQPAEGHRFNPAKLLLDPYAREICGAFDWSEPHFGADPAHRDQPDSRDNAATALKARVVSHAPEAVENRRPPIPLAETILYEVHVKGFSKLNPAVPVELRGTYAGLAHEASVAHLQRLGITAVSLLPVHQHLDEERLTRAGLSNYWGYNTIGFFAVEPRLACTPTDGAAVRDEFRQMVRALHAAGIEVILDVVFNHTAESDVDGPTISWRGLDNATYYRLPPNDRSDYENFAGCGNTVDLRHPRVLQMVMDSLRFWVTEYQVDGYRFDLATVLGRGDNGFDRRAAFFAAVAQDPVLAHVKMIAEPWDIGPDGYQAGAFPGGWAEWNDKFRDDMRSFWLRHPASRGAFAQRLCASSDRFQTRGRSPAESVNYVVSHDGFTLHDLLSFDEKHNLANLENNRDGTTSNHSFNAGVEGPTDDPAVLQLRARLSRALIATTLLAQGTPMLSAGDELGHTQGGNNNPYCTDSDATWIDWSAVDADLLAFTARTCGLRRALMPFADRWYTGVAGAGGVPDVVWQTPTGDALQPDDWGNSAIRTLACTINETGRSAPPLLLLVNGGVDDTPFELPPGTWNVRLDTTRPTGEAMLPGQVQTRLTVEGGSLMLLVLNTVAPPT